MDLKKLAEDMRHFDGLTRKRDIGKLVEALGADIGEGDDAAVIHIGREKLLFACDSINDELVQADPFFAGYSAVLVNVNDIAAMGGVPVALVDSISSHSIEDALGIATGMKEASRKFGVPIIGGHYNPGSSHKNVSIAVIGRLPGGHALNGASSKAGEDIIMAVDICGRTHPNYPLAWDSTTMKDAKTVQDNLRTLAEIAESELATSARDISSPGVMGTLAMMLEQSRCGANITLDHIPRPPNVPMDKWLKMYPGHGFLMTAGQSDSAKITGIFQDRGVAAQVIGEVKEEQKLLIRSGGSVEEVLDFSRTCVTGVKK